jgi:acetyl-CoA C-acetyltransferase
VASKACDIALAMGVEKLKDVGYGGLPRPDLGRLDALIGENGTAPGWYALSATRYFAHYNIPPEEGKRALAHISYKSHQNGVKSPKAHLRKAVTIEEILNAPMVAYPLGLFDCCGVSDGAAAAIVTTPEIAKSMGKGQVLVKSVQIAGSNGEEYWYTDWDGTSLVTAYKAGQRAYEEAGMRNPRKELSMMDVHDCFSITELLLYEGLQISPRGKAIEDVMNGFFDLDGQLPCQSDGGLKCFGHPVGASGLRMLYEMYNQLLERAGERQIKNARLGLTHNMGGMPYMNVCSVAIVGRD